MTARFVTSSGSGRGLGRLLGSPPHARWRRLALSGLLGLLASGAQADLPVHHNGVDKVYHPYVQPLERELEFRSVYQHDDDPNEDGLLRQRIGFGRAVTDRWFAEGYLLGRRIPGQSLRLDGFEVESLFQLTEQGEFAADWGVLVEVERFTGAAITEVSARLLVEKEFGRWTGALNVGPEYEFGSGIANEFDSIFHAQWRYRLSPRLQPGIEIHRDELTSATGFLLQGVERLGGTRRLNWELGVLAPFNNTTPESTFRLMLDLEF